MLETYLNTNLTIRLPKKLFRKLRQIFLIKCFMGLKTGGGVDDMSSISFSVENSTYRERYGSFPLGGSATCCFDPSCSPSPNCPKNSLRFSPKVGGVLS